MHSLQDDDAKPRLRCVFSRHASISAVSDFSHMSQSQTPTRSPFENYHRDVQVGFASVASDGNFMFSTFGHAPIRNTGDHSSQMQTQRPFVYAELPLGKTNIFSSEPMSQQKAMRKPNLFYGELSSSLKTRNRSTTPIICTTHLPTRSLSAESSASSDATEDSILSHITVKIPNDVQPGIVKRKEPMRDVLSKDVVPRIDPQQVTIAAKVRMSRRR
jgi:hypothetical protein